MPVAYYDIDGGGTLWQSSFLGRDWGERINGRDTVRVRRFQLISVQAAGRLWSLTAVTLRTDNPFFAERAQLVGLALRLLFSRSAGDRRQLRWWESWRWPLCFFDLSAEVETFVRESSVNEVRRIATASDPGLPFMATEEPKAWRLKESCH